ncbi:MAG: 5'-nucleotidase C-terminal domain-containing protein, partial [Pseudomonadota bacterium]
ALPRGLVDQIIAGHEHRGIAHEVNGIAITNSFSNARAFGRVDYRVRRDTEVVERTVHPPHRVCLTQVPGEERCAEADDPRAAPPRYEGRSTAPSRAVLGVVEAALARADQARRRPLNVVLETPITRRDGPNSAIGHLMTDAIREATGADVSIHNVVGGIRADLPAGPLTFGDVYRVFPFDNRVAVIDMTGRALETLLAHQVHNTSRRAGVSGLSVRVACASTGLDLTLVRPDGSIVGNGDVLSVAANDFLLFGGDGIFTPVTPEDGFDVDNSQPRVRDMWVDWFLARGGTLHADDYRGEGRWVIPPSVLRECAPPR